MVQEALPSLHTHEREMTMGNWTMVGGMSFVMTGGANAPDHVRFTRAPAQAQATGNEQGA